MPQPIIPRLRFAGFALGLITLTASGAWAQDSAAAAQVLFDDARAAMATKSFDIACDKFRESDRLDPAVGTRFNLANCEEQRGRLATAWSLYRQVLDEVQPGDVRAPVARARVEALDLRVPRLTLHSKGELPVGTTATVAGLVLQPAAFGSPIPIDPGRHVVLVASPGTITRQFTINLAPGESVEISVDVGPHPKYSRNLSPIPRQGETSSPSSTERNPVAAYVVGGIGVAGILTGVTTGLVGLHQESIGDAGCNDQTRTCTAHAHEANQRARSFATVSTIGFVTGLVGLGVGTYLWFTLPDSAASAISIGPANQGATVEWRQAW